MKEKNHPGIYIPPPIIYAAFFFFSIFLQLLKPINSDWLSNPIMHVLSFALLLLFFLFSFPSFRLFFVSNNTLLTIKPATSLMTRGIYRISRNPMYVSLICLYLALAIWFGNSWTFILLPLLIYVVRYYIIGREEKYLTRRFGEEYESYQSKVRRWI